MNKFKILYIDDEQINLQLFKINFRKNFEVYVADNGYEGLEKLQEINDIVVVICDMKMPYMNGLEFVKKAKVSFPDIKYFILTGFEITEEINNALNEGLIVKYFRKPFDRSELDLSIREAIEE